MSHGAVASTLCGGEATAMTALMSSPAAALAYAKARARKGMSCRRALPWPSGPIYVWA
jgi:hypothetical protein